MIKLLRGQSEKVSVEEKLKVIKKGKRATGAKVKIEFEVPVVDSALQTRLLDLSRYVYSEEGKQKYIACQLNNCITDGELEINGSVMSASELATMADYGDVNTASILGIISREIDKLVFISGEEAKKS